MIVACPTIGLVSPEAWYLRECQYTTHHGVLQHHVGTATSAPWRVIWDTRWLPDQNWPVRLRARITDVTGMSYLTVPIEVRQHRELRSVRMFISRDVPEYFSVRVGHEKYCSINLPDDLSGLKSARLLVSTWSPTTDDESLHELRLNGVRLVGGHVFGHLPRPSHLQPGSP